MFLSEVIIWVVYAFHLVFMGANLLDSFLKFTRVSKLSDSSEKAVRLQFWGIAVYSQLIYFLRSLSIWSFTIKKRFKFFKILSDVAFALSPAYQLFFYISIINIYRSFILHLKKEKKSLSKSEILKPYFFVTPFFIPRWCQMGWDLIKIILYDSLNLRINDTEKDHSTLINHIRSKQWDDLLTNKSQLSHTLIYLYFCSLVICYYYFIQTKCKRTLAKNRVELSKIKKLDNEWRLFTISMLVGFLLSFMCSAAMFYDNNFATKNNDKFFHAESEKKRYWDKYCSGKKKETEGLIFISNLNQVDFICDIVSTISIRFFAPCRHV